MRGGNKNISSESTLKNPSYGINAIMDKLYNDSRHGVPSLANGGGAVPGPSASGGPPLATSAFESSVSDRDGLNSRVTSSDNFSFFYDPDAVSASGEDLSGEAHSNNQTEHVKKKRRVAPNSPETPRVINVEKPIKNWSRFLVVEAENPQTPLSNLSPWAIQKGIEGMSRSIKNIKKISTGVFLIECPDAQSSRSALARN